MMKGQTLVILLFFMAAAIIITSAAVVIIVVNSLSGSRLQEGVVTYEIAESGAENALIRLLRDPSYAGETLTIGSGNVTISVTGVNLKTITSIGVLGNFTRTVEVRVTENQGFLTINSWKEIF
ncbi:hypothetical protein HY008_02090 [Candidatus Woesebacteria bacterium]|nr:hypothetical protein [Candidatus Woesebacteria bacterium]